MNNRQNFNQTGGFPLKTSTLDEMQNAYDIFNQLGYIVGNRAIISGCEVAGGNTASGFISIDGELLPFDGGATLSRVRIVETTTAKEFENGQTKNVVFKRKAVFTLSVTNSFAWSGFKRGLQTSAIQALLDAKATIAALNDAVADITALKKMCAVFVANGCIMPWGKPANEIPEGWVPWNEAPGRVLVGRDANDVQFQNTGNTGGTKTITLTAPNMPKQNVVTPGIAGTDSGDGFVTTGNQTLPGGSIGTVGNDNPTSIAIMNPYRVVEYIHYTG